MNARTKVKSSNVDKYLVFAFGVIFISVLLWLVFRETTPLTEDKAKLVHLVSALAAAGVGAALPGNIDIQHRTWLRAGGAVALFVLVFVYDPARSVAPPGTWPNEDPDRVIQRHLSLIDKGDYDAAYDGLSAEAKKQYSKAEFIKLFSAYRMPFGDVKSRNLIGINTLAEFQGLKGPFKGYGYITSFASGVTAQEPIWTIVTGKNEWGVFSHVIYPCPNNQCGIPSQPIPPSALPDASNSLYTAPSISK